MPLLARELRKDGEAGAVVEDRVEGIAALVWLGAADEERLRAASRAGVPIIAVTDEESLPYVLAGDLVRVPPGQGFPVDKIAEAIAAQARRQRHVTRGAPAGAAAGGLQGS